MALCHLPPTQCPLGSDWRVTSIHSPSTWGVPAPLGTGLGAGEMGMSKSNGQDRETPTCDLSVEIGLSAVEGNRRDIGRGTHLDGGE